MLKKKITKFIALLLVCSFCIAGCGSKSADNNKKVDMKKLQESMLNSVEGLDKLEVKSSSDSDAKDTFAILCDMDYDRVDEFFYAYASDAEADEIAVVKLKDKSDVAPLMERLQKHVDQRVTTFQEYEPKLVSVIENAIITRQGVYVAMIIGEKNGLVQKEFEKCME